MPKKKSLSPFSNVSLAGIIVAIYAAIVLFLSIAFFLFYG